MIAHSPIRLSATVKPTFTLSPNGLLQRKCTCGGTPGPSGECGECSRKRLSEQRRASLGLQTFTIDTVARVAGVLMPIADDFLRKAAARKEAHERREEEQRRMKLRNGARSASRCSPWR
jgi:hypothetical protein